MYGMLAAFRQHSAAGDQARKGALILEEQNKPQQQETGFAKLKKNKAFWVCVYVAIAALFVGGVILVIQQYFIIQEEPYVAPPTATPVVTTPTPAPTATLAPTPTPVPTPTPYVKTTPKRLYFTGYQVYSDVYPVGIQNGNIGTVDSANDSAWFEPYYSPGGPGNAIISGHNSWKKKKGTFSVIHDMSPGDEVVVEFDGPVFKYFEVAEILTVTLDDFPAELIEPEGEPRLTLITCLGDYDRAYGGSRSRVIAICHEKEAPVVE